MPSSVYNNGRCCWYHKRLATIPWCGVHTNWACVWSLWQQTGGGATGRLLSGVSYTSCRGHRHGIGYLERKVESTGCHGYYDIYINLVRRSSTDADKLYHCRMSWWSYKHLSGNMPKLVNHKTRLYFFPHQTKWSFTNCCINYILDILTQSAK